MYIRTFMVICIGSWVSVFYNIVVEFTVLLGNSLIGRKRFRTASGGEFYPTILYQLISSRMKLFIKYYIISNGPQTFAKTSLIKNIYPTTTHVFATQMQTIIVLISALTSRSIRLYVYYIYIEKQKQPERGLL